MKSRYNSRRQQNNYTLYASTRVSEQMKENHLDNLTNVDNLYAKILELKAKKEMCLNKLQDYSRNGFGLRSTTSSGRSYHSRDKDRELFNPYVRIPHRNEQRQRKMTSPREYLKSLITSPNNELIPNRPRRLKTRSSMPSPPRHNNYLSNFTCMNIERSQLELANRHPNHSRKYREHKKMSHSMDYAQTRNSDGVPSFGNLLEKTRSCRRKRIQLDSTKIDQKIRTKAPKTSKISSPRSTADFRRKTDFETFIEQTRNSDPNVNERAALISLKSTIEKRLSELDSTSEISSDLQSPFIKKQLFSSSKAKRAVNRRRINTEDVFPSKEEIESIEETTETDSILETTPSEREIQRYIKKYYDAEDNFV